MKNLLVFNCGIEVKIIVLEKKGFITGINIRDDRIIYEVTYNNSGKIETAWFAEYELCVDHKKELKIGFFLEDNHA
jgi:hypothetical protein